jgi:hypothetical protein
MSGGYGAMHDINSQLLAKYALDEANATAGGAGDNTEVNGIAISLAALASRAHSVSFIIWLRATLAAAATLAVEYTLQYSVDSGSNWLDVTGKANIANAAVLTGGAGGTTEKGTLKFGMNLTQLPPSTTHIRCQVLPNLSAGATDTATIAGIAVFGGLNNYPQ